MTLEDDTVRADVLRSQLRVWLRRQQDPAHIQAVALVYELAALIVRAAPNQATALAILEMWTQVMKNQIEHVGVGVEES